MIVALSAADVNNLMTLTSLLRNRAANGTAGANNDDFHSRFLSRVRGYSLIKQISDKLAKS